MAAHVTIYRKISADLLLPELVFSTARSSGPGGQNVNKVSSKVLLRWSIPHSNILSIEQKETLYQKWASRLTTKGELLLSSQEKKSQLQNKEAVINKLNELLTRAFVPKKTRKATKPSKAAIQARIEKKKKQSEKKKLRKAEY
ncbi:MAG: alternative ribosome rescue aminoacyl-tRNA hydrolase ArfB [Flammeovirgaceae bacterium]